MAASATARYMFIRFYLITIIIVTDRIIILTTIIKLILKKAKSFLTQAPAHIVTWQQEDQAAQPGSGEDGEDCGQNPAAAKPLHYNEHVQRLNLGRML